MRLVVYSTTGTVILCSVGLDGEIASSEYQDIDSSRLSQTGQ